QQVVRRRTVRDGGHGRGAQPSRRGADVPAQPELGEDRAGEHVGQGGLAGDGPRPGLEQREEQVLRQRPVGRDGRPAPATGRYGAHRRGSQRKNRTASATATQTQARGGASRRSESAIGVPPFQAWTTSSVAAPTGSSRLR